jgi:DNA ligase-4
LEGELVVYSGKTHKILDFHKIRKHVSRSGSFLGTDKDSQAHPWEHLMIVYYDLLMVDNESLLAVKHSERFQRLKSLITLIPGRSSLVKRELIDCGRRSAVSDLRRAFAKCITARGEGLVLKADDPYFDFGTLRRPYSCCAIKLKKEYIGRFGDIGDFAVVGARFDAAKARTYNIPRLKWTHFYVGCLENKDEVQRFGKQPRFVVTNVVELNATQLAAFVSSVNPEAVRPEDNTAVSLRIEPGVDGGKRPSVIFPTPPVFDLRCFSFDKEGNTGFWSPRFASVSKIHTDRTYHDTISFAELQEMATKEREAPPPEDSQELLGWIAALENSESRTAVDTASQSTISTVAESATQSTQPMEPAASSRIADQAGATLGRKRPLESSTQSSIPDRSKIQRRSSDQVASATPLPDNNGIGPSVRGREPSVGSQTTLSQRTAATLPMLRPSRRTAATLPMLRPSSAGSVQQAGSHSKRDDARPPLQASVSFPSMMSQAFSAASRTGQTEKGSVSSHGAGHQRSDKPIDSGTVKPTDIATVNATDNSAAKATDNVTDHAADKATDNASANGINNTTADASVNVADEAAENTAAKCQFSATCASSEPIPSSCRPASPTSPGSPTTCSAATA